MKMQVLFINILTFFSLHMYCFYYINTNKKTWDKYFFPLTNFSLLIFKYNLYIIIYFFYIKYYSIAICSKYLM